ncbi:hypothetical protein, partial [Nocardia brasiliensis]|uniref:hypothetical protein n=1 Tax=Nocardia brasiliensis TaxID=37326 RepID=UPI0024588FF1
MSVKTTALRAIPVLGWVYLAGGLVAAAPVRAPAHRVVGAAGWVFACLCLVVDAGQIRPALR